MQILRNLSKHWRARKAKKSGQVKKRQEGRPRRPPDHVSMGLTDEQKRVMEENRRRALAKRQQKAANPTAAAPSAQTASKPLQPQQQSLVMSPNPVKGSFYSQVRDQCT